MAKMPTLTFPDEFFFYQRHFYICTTLNFSEQRPHKAQDYFPKGVFPAFSKHLILSFSKRFIYE